MAASKFLKLLNGRPTEEAPVNTGGAGNADKVVALGASGTLDPTMFPAGIGADIVVVPASEALSAGNLINLWTNSGATNARKADASTTGKQCDGFVLASVSSGANATVYRNGQNTAVTGQTIGDGWLSATTPGAIQSTPPTGTGQTVQKIGRVVTATLADVQPGQDYALA